MPDPVDALADTLANLRTETGLYDHDGPSPELQAFCRVAGERNWGVNSPVWRRNWKEWFEEDYNAADDNPFVDEPHNAYFDKFPTFTTNPRNTLKQQFAHLAAHQGWVKGTEEWDRELQKLSAEQPKTAPALYVNGTHSTYFDRFEGFTPSAGATLNQQFKNLAKQQGWGKNDEVWKRERAELFGEEFASIFGTEGTLQEWQKFCASVGVASDLPSVTACKKALKGVFVNIVNLLDHERNHGIPLMKFPNHKKFFNYTMSGNIFPLYRAKQNKFLKALLRKLF